MKSPRGHGHRTIRPLVMLPAEKSSSVITAHDQKQQEVAVRWSS